MIAIGIDIGGTSIKGAAITDKGEVLDVFALDVVKEDSQEETISKLITVINEYNERHNYNKDNVLGIGVGIPGSININEGVVCFSNNLRWYDLPIVKLIEEGTGLPVRITNDANAATLGEAKFGAGRACKDIVMLTLGTGVGGGVVVDGKLVEGNQGKGTELGHTTLILDGLPCTCGRRGCLEQYASATALIRETKKAMDDNENSIMWDFAKEYGKVNGRVAFEAMRKGDQIARDVVDYYVKCLGEGILNYANIFRPEAIVLSGGIAKEGEFLTSRLYKYCKEQNFGYIGTPEVQILTSELGYDAGKIGAASLFFE